MHIRVQRMQTTLGPTALYDNYECVSWGPGEGGEGSHNGPVLIMHQCTCLTNWINDILTHIMIFASSVPRDDMPLFQLLMYSQCWWKLAEPIEPHDQQLTAAMLCHKWSGQHMHRFCRDFSTQYIPCTHYPYHAYSPYHSNNSKSNSLLTIAKVTCTTKCASDNDEKNILLPTYSEWNFTPTGHFTPLEICSFNFTKLI